MVSLELASLGYTTISIHLQDDFTSSLIMHAQLSLHNTLSAFMGSVIECLLFNLTKTYNFQMYMWIASLRPYLLDLMLRHLCGLTDCFSSPRIIMRTGSHEPNGLNLASVGENSCQRTKIHN